MLLFLTYSKQLRILPAVIVKGIITLRKEKFVGGMSAYHLLILESIINNDDGLRRSRGIGVGSAAAGRVIIVGW